MGVSGSGKSTIGRKIAEKCGYPFFDGDDFHPESNVQKMSDGKALKDEDRYGWLESINSHALSQTRENGVVYACSALKESYRKMLSSELDNVCWVYLSGTFELINHRMAQRKGHFMPVGLLKSQFDTLEPPSDCIQLDIGQTVDEMVTEVVRKLSTSKDQINNG